MATRDVFILLVNYQGMDDTLACLESLYAIENERWLPVVCDNGSDDAAIQRLHEWGEQAGVTLNAIHREQIDDGSMIDEVHTAEGAQDKPPLTLLLGGENLGFTGGNNLGMTFALRHKAMRHCWLLNNDTTVLTDTLSALLEAAEKDDRLGIVGSKLVYAEDPDIIQAAGGGTFSLWSTAARHFGDGDSDTWPDPWQATWDEPFQPQYVCGASMFIRREVIERVGLLDDDLFLYGEDLDYALRARKAGWRLSYCPASVVVHKHGGSTGAGHSPLHAYYDTRNTLRVVAKHWPWALPWVLAVRLARSLASRLLRGRFAEARAVCRGAWHFVIDRRGRSHAKASAVKGAPPGGSR